MRERGYRRTIGGVALADDEDGYPRRFDPKDDLLHVVVPDDPRELEPEIAAYHRELELARRHERHQRWRYRFLPKWAHGGLPSPVFTAVLLVVATTGLLLSVFAPVTQESRNRLPISSLAAPSALDGHIGGLLPDVELVGASSPIQTRTVRPAVFVLVPAKCDCADLIRQVVGQTNEVPAAPYVLLVSAGTDPTAARLANAKDGGHGQALGVQDLDGILAKTYHPDAKAPTLLLVGGDGRLLSKLIFHDGDRIESALDPLHFPA
jgi:hypothetical protein